MLAGILFAIISLGILSLAIWTVSRDRADGDPSTGIFAMRNERSVDEPEE